jgi:hypothetical protein
MPDRFNVKTVGGHELSEVASAFQKSIRRGLEDEALHWGVELDLSGFGEYAWKRLRIMTSEDIGLRAGTTGTGLRSTELVRPGRSRIKACTERLFFIHAILLLVRAKKAAGSSITLLSPTTATTKREIQTPRTNHMGRSPDGSSVKHFFVRGLRSARSDLPDEYEERARETMLRAEQERKGTLPIFGDE